MEGPTPVSALIHAATMVTAGVYMVARSHSIFDKAPAALTVVAIIGTLTALFAATIGIAQTDIKRVLAYSTISQLGYMFMACGVAAYSAGIFHLMTHAFFKGLLFLAAGSVIHAIGGEQDMRRMGGLRHHIPWTFLTMSVATFAIAGFPPLAGFFSKDEILWRAYSNPYGSWVYWLIGVITAFLTSFYMFRLWFLTFFGEYRGPQADGVEYSAAHIHQPDDAGPHRGIHESPKIMLLPLAVLAILSLSGGWIGSHRFEKFLSPVFQAGAVSAAEQGSASGASEPAARQQEPGLETLFTLISVAAAAFGLYLAWQLYLNRPQLPQYFARALGRFYQAVAHKYYVDELYAILFVRPLLEGSERILWRAIDQNLIDAAVNDAAYNTRRVSDMIRHMQSGNIRSYAAWVAVGATAVIAYMVWLGIR
jgi:NADH-quinone oxidoreductase subunit L